MTLPVNRNVRGNVNDVIVNINGNTVLIIMCAMNVVYRQNINVKDVALIKQIFMEILSGTNCRVKIKVFGTSRRK